MKKIVSRVLTLTLILVLICAFTTAAFAETEATIGHPYPGCEIDGIVRIERRKISATMTFEPYDGTDYSGSIYVSYTYYLHNHSGMNDYKTASVSNTIESPRTGGTASKTYAAGEIFTMRDATANFYANITTAEDTVNYRPTRYVSFPYPSA